MCLQPCNSALIQDLRVAKATLPVVVIKCKCLCLIDFSTSNDIKIVCCSLQSGLYTQKRGEKAKPMPFSMSSGRVQSLSLEESKAQSQYQVYTMPQNRQ